jgi:UDP-GlcNAc:undecaprenyl-phosphate GlcNAc-1-phosphate transferase
LIGPGLAVFFLFLAALALSLIFTRLMMRLARGWGFMDQPSERKLHAVATPLGGGIAIFLAVVLPIIVGFLMVAGFVSAKSDVSSTFTVDLTRHFEGVMSKSRELIAVLLGGFMIMLLGLADDIRRVSVREKLFIQAVIGAALASVGVRVSLFVEAPFLGGVVTVLWIVAITNAFNLIDNMDGLCATVAGVISLIFLVAAVQTGQLFIGAFLAVLLGALLGFLAYNRPPARIFMGDTGSLFTGYLLATLTILFTFYGSKVRVEGGTVNRLYPFLVPLLIFAVPIFDTLSVIHIRMKERRPIWRADRSHFSHRLLNLGMTTRGALLTVALATFCTGISAVLLYPGDGSTASDMVRAAIVVAQAVAILTLVVLLERASRRKDVSGRQKK